MRESASRQWHGSVRRSPSGGEELAAAVNLVDRDRPAHHARLGGEEFAHEFDCLPPVPASRCNRPACRRARVSSTALASSRRCRAASATISASRLSQGMSGWRRIVPVDEHGASSSTASNGPPRHSATSAATVSAASERRARFCLSRSSRFGARSTAVTCAPAAASCAVLPPGAAQRSATVRPATSPRSRDGQCGGGVLHPPRAVLIAGQRRHRPMHDRAHRAGRQHASAERARPVRRVVLHRQIERRFLAVGERDRAGGLVAVVLDPARHQPIGRVEKRGVHAGEMLRAAAGDAAQHGIDETGIVHGAPVGLHQTHGQVDRGVVGNSKPAESARRRSAARSRPAAHRRECRDRDRARAGAAAFRAGAGPCRQDGAPARGRAPRGSRDRSPCRRVARRAADAGAARPRAHWRRRRAPRGRPAVGRCWRSKPSGSLARIGAAGRPSVSGRRCPVPLDNPRRRSYVDGYSLTEVGV